jgi:WD40 repeat protein
MAKNKKVFLYLKTGFSPKNKIEYDNYGKVLEVLPLLWTFEIKHTVIVGDGGMGKTVSLIQWWKKLLETGEHRQGEPVPVFIALNEFNQVPEEERKDFIMASVLKNYGGDDRYLAAVFDGSRVNEKDLFPRGHSGRVNSAVYSPDGETILSVSYDRTIKEWETTTGKCLKTHQKKDHPQIPGYPPYDKSIELITEGNKIYVAAASAKGKSRELINIPGLFIQGCSFQNL